mmetsp:Transcript_44610/g.143889  ORF Transcript_44610/g.143889 Transcript_44610/m.143889 type:complete len:119 (-) Transcript_44610:1152-1508(-)
MSLSKDCIHAPMLRSGRRLSYTSAYKLKHLEQNTPGRAQASHLRAGSCQSGPLPPATTCSFVREASEADVSTAIYFFASMIFGCALRYSRCSFGMAAGCLSSSGGTGCLHEVSMTLRS